jgi:hypothetical protein
MLMLTSRLFALAGCTLALVAQTAWTQDEPPAEPLPSLDDIRNDTRRALVVEALIRSDGTAELGQVLVSQTPPRSNIGNPPLMLVEWFDADGNPLGDMNAWDPRWEFQHTDAGEQVVVLPEGLGAFFISFNHQIASVKIHDQEAALELLTVDVSEVVAEFCTQNPDDPNCENLTPPNSPPEADAGGPYLVAVNTDVLLDASASTDPDGDTLTYLWAAPGGGGIDDATHPAPTFTATTAGIYPLTLEVCDPFAACDTAESSVVVYDPAGGFVTGGGWIDSWPGSCGPAAPDGVCEDDPTGRATFGFVARYKKGAAAPDGNTAFVFQAASLRFDSDSYDWLVVAGKDRAQFKGMGSIDGVPGYEFMLTAYDGGDTNPDGFRIKIWTGTDLVYDNLTGADDSASQGNTQPLSGGSIVIHTK